MMERAGFEYWEIEKYPPELQGLARVLVKHEDDLSDGFQFYLGWEEDAGPLLPILQELLDAVLLRHGVADKCVGCGAKVYRCMHCLKVSHHCLDTWVPAPYPPHEAHRPTYDEQYSFPCVHCGKRVYLRDAVRPSVVFEQ